MMGIRFWSMFRLPVDTRDISGRLRRRDGSQKVSALFVSI
jgi:hypothetical protein